MTTKRRRRWWVPAAILSVVVLLAYGTYIGAGIHSAFDGVEPPVDGARVGPAVTVVDGYVAAFVIEAGDGDVVLVDAGKDPEARRIRDALAGLGHEPSDVSAILLTHGHEDHRGGVAEFPEARIHAHVDELPLLAGEVRSEGPVPWWSGHAEPLEVTDPVRDGDDIRIGDLSIRAFHLPGHTAGSVAWLVEDTLFLGDSATSVETGGMEPSPWVFTGDPEDNRASLAELPERLDRAGADVETIVFSHAAPLDGMEPLRDLADRLRADP